MIALWLLAIHIAVLGYWLGSELVINSTYRYVSYSGDMPFAERARLMEHVMHVDQHVRYALALQATLGTALAALAPGGTCVTFGVSAGADVTFDARTFFIGGRATLYGFYLFQELGLEPAAVGLRRLADLVAAGQLTPHISVERPWKDVGQVAQDLINRRFPGKAVLAVD